MQIWWITRPRVFRPRHRVTARITPHFLQILNHAIDMAHIGRAEGYREELPSDDDLDIVRSVRKGAADTDQYIESKSSQGGNPLVKCILTTSQMS